jgi:hypothetical protein
MISQFLFMKKRMPIAMILVLLLPGSLLLAQGKGFVIGGKVISFEESFPLEGVLVQVKGTQNTTGTMVDGTYVLEIKPGDSILVFSYEGYEKRELVISRDKTEYNVILKSKTVTLCSWLSNLDNAESCRPRYYRAIP